MPAQLKTAASPLGQLVAPLTEEEFLFLLRERRLTVLRATNSDRYASWLNWDALKRLIDRGEYSRGRDDFRVSKESVTVPPGNWSRDGKVDSAKVEEYLEKGFSVVMTRIEPYVPPLTALSNDIRARLNENTFAGVIATSGADGAFRIHYDPEDLIIVQIEGTKRWQIFGPPVPNPVGGMPKQAAPRTAPIFDEVLQPGDLLFVPGGNWHHCQAGPGRSVHLGIFFLPPTSYHAAKALTAELLSEELFRRPLTRLGASDLSTLEAEVKDRLVERIHRMNFREFLSEWSKKI